MSGPGSDPAAERDEPRAADETTREAVERRRRLAKVFGEVLPEGTRDERGDGWGERGDGEGAGSEEWLRRQVPPHHG